MNGWNNVVNLELDFSRLKSSSWFLWFLNGSLVTFDNQEKSGLYTDVMVFTPPQKKKTCCQKCREILAECQLKCGQKAEVSPVVVMSRALGKVPSAHGKLSGLIDIFKSSFIYIIISICIYLVGIFNINIYYIILPSALRPSWWKLPFFFRPWPWIFFASSLERYPKPFPEISWAELRQHGRNRASAN